MQITPTLKKKPPLRLVELQLLVAPALLVLLGMLIVISVPNQRVGWDAKDLWMPFVFIGLLLVTHLVLTIWLPRSDQLIMPLVSALSAFGLIMSQRLETTRTGNIASRQVLWVVLGYTTFLIVALGLRNIMALRRYKYTFLFLGLLLTAAVTIFGQEVNGARLWFRFGIFSFQPSELLKVMLVVFLAAYLDDKREVILSTNFRLGPIPLPPFPYLMPMLGILGIALLTMIVQKELGAAELFFGVFLIMLFAATGRASYVIVGLVLIIAGFALIYVLSANIDQLAHVRVRVDAWLNPWPTGQGRSYQIVQALFSFAEGGVFGQGIGQGAPYFIPEVHTDYVMAAIGEEMGLAGALGILGLDVLLVYRGFHIALHTTNGFYQFLAIGISAIFGIQTLIIVGGVTKLIPLSGMTLPFISYGGSSILVNFLMAGLLVRLSLERDSKV
ncbi:MAG: FtsW/RodA/SpoVE family cell cycle protein [Chloroflexi bacterium]|uniref:FtsW/RodA/SpoVE family cell cycle protein n=1 Tax=Candidatus Chlorohelix allophototropha TaxID=3003348 RepID=A0A8T7LS04_9CHLR|nr:FtsW/RodA/SpoVE family cell cycle protein [Chloroflexota bacterium]WJW66677.1 FtsW/RodA/SpoVE family cell cycle protein [Chloroflexota bacterium L227-S17]